MWDTVQTNEQHISHDMPCPRCGHALHTFLGCDDECGCLPALMPGEQQELASA
jgi:hypothetical protein